MAVNNWIDSGKKNTRSYAMNTTNGFSNTTNGFYQSKIKKHIPGDPDPEPWLSDSSSKKSNISNDSNSIKSVKEKRDKKKKRQKKKKKDMSDSWSSDSDSSDDSDYRRKQRKKKSHQEKDPIKLYTRLTTCSSPRCLVRSHSLVCSENPFSIVGIGPIPVKEL